MQGLIWWSCQAGEQRKNHFCVISNRAHEVYSSVEVVNGWIDARVAFSNASLAAGTTESPLIPVSSSKV